jgi:aryl-alcohol dehydrogenase-like predicted oxidoreductase
MVYTSHATPEGTDTYQKRFSEKLAPGHFRLHQGCWLSSIGLGTYLGHHDITTDTLYREAIIRALELGCNVIDTAINYRCQRSERVIGQALSLLFKEGRLKREEVLIATKGGFIPFDGEPPRNPRAYILETFVKPGILTFEDIVADCHCLAPRYIQNQLDRSLKNLGLGCVDIYYLHNPETQLSEVSREEFYRRMKAAFQVLEENVTRGKIQWYGTATWDGYRTSPQAPDYLSLQDLVELAREVGGETHHFKVIQLPYNLAMAEAFTHQNQEVGGEVLSVFEAAQRLGITVMTSASIYQSRLARNLPSTIYGFFPGVSTDAQRAIQFVRSTPGVTTALVGMKQRAHVEENLKTALTPPMSQEEFMRLFSQAS